MDKKEGKEMLHWKKGKKGFTLIELLVVVIIVAVLAAVGVPLLSGNVERARMSEAEAGLGTIRTSLRAYFAEHNAYVTGSPISINIGLKTNDLLGRFFEDDDYNITGAQNNAATYCITATGDTTGLAPRGDKVNGLARSMDEDGDMYSSGNCSGSPLNS